MKKKTYEKIKSKINEVVLKEIYNLGEIVQEVDYEINLEFTDRTIKLDFEFNNDYTKQIFEKIK